MECPCVRECEFESACGAACESVWCEGVTFMEGAGDGDGEGEGEGLWDEPP